MWFFDYVYPAAKQEEELHEEEVEDDWELPEAKEKAVVPATLTMDVEENDEQETEIIPTDDRYMEQFLPETIAKRMSDIKGQVLQETESRYNIDTEKCALDIMEYLLTPGVFDKALNEYKGSLIQRGVETVYPQLCLTFSHALLSLTRGPLPSSVVDRLRYEFFRRLGYKVGRVQHFAGISRVYIDIEGVK